MKLSRTLNLNIPRTYSQFSQTFEIEWEDEKACNDFLNRKTLEAFESYKSISQTVTTLVTDQDTAFAEQVKKLQTEVANLNKEIEVRSAFRKHLETIVPKDTLTEATKTFKETPEYKKLAGIVDEK